MENNELINIVGGASSINGTILNSISRLFSTLLEIGRTIGSSIRRAQNKNYC